MGSGLVDVIDGNDSFVVTSHPKPDGDAVGSQLATYNFLTSLGKKALVLSDPIPKIYRFLPGSDSVDGEIKEHHRNSRVVIIVDCASLERVKGRELIDAVPISINIDHHPHNTGFGTYNCVDTTVAASAEIIYDILQEYKHPMTYEVALCLYTAISADTGSFCYANTNSKTHRMAADFIRCGVSPSKVSRELYESKTLEEIRLMGLVMNTLKVSEDGRIGWIHATRQMFDITNTEESDADGLVNYARSVDGVKVAVFFRELKGGKIRVSLRSYDDIDVEQIARKFGGGGHTTASGCILEGTIQNATDLLLQAVRSAVDSQSKM
ncbi:MAG: DHH family phosphoesterase [bacterium]